MKKLILLVLLLPAIYNVFSQTGSLSYSQPKPYEIDSIEISGAEYLDRNAIKSLSGLKEGDKITIPGDDITNALKKLWKQGLLGNISIYATKLENGKAWLKFELKERPRLSKVEYMGISSSQQTEIDKDIDLILGKVITDAVVANTKLAIEKFFIAKGFLNVKVDIDRKKDETRPNSVKLLIEIEKGSKVRINSIDIHGNDHLYDARIRKKMKGTHEFPRLAFFKNLAQGLYHTKPKKYIEYISKSHPVSKKGFRTWLNKNFKLNFFTSSKFVEADYGDDLNNIIEFYNSKGYRDAKIVSDTITNHDRRSINIDITVDEGKKYYFRDINWKGNFIHKDETLSRILGVKKGDVYNMELINKKLNFNPNGPDISSLYMDNGYLFFSIVPIETRIEADSIDIEMRIHEGEQATINKVIITGNDRTNDHVVRREVRTLPGQKFSRANIIRTNRELAGLGYFNPETIDIQPLPNPADGTVDILYKLEEKPSDQIELSGGWGGAFGFVGTVGITFNNFSLKNINDRSKWHPLPTGDGQKLSLRLQANGKRYQNYSISFQEPWLGGKKPNSLSVSLSRSIQRSGGFTYDSFGRVLQSTGSFTGSLKLTAITVGLGRRVKWPDDYFSVQNSINFLFYDLDGFGQSLGFKDGTGNANNVNLGMTIQRNSAGPNTIFPTTGSQVTLTMNFTPPYSVFNNLDYETITNNERYKWVEYHKYLLDTKFYTAIVGNLVLAAKAHMGFIGNYTKKAGIGPFERFVMGGSGLGTQNFIIGNDIIGLRGYQDNEVTPPTYTASSQSSTTDQDRLRGGIIYNKFAMELRYPVSLNPSATIYVLGFVEAGNNWGSSSDFNFNQLYKSSGMGARIFMPAFGLIGIDWAYGFDTLPGRTSPSGAQFHFTIGQQLR